MPGEGFTLSGTHRLQRPSVTAQHFPNSFTANRCPSRTGHGPAEVLPCVVRGGAKHTKKCGRVGRQTWSHGGMLAGCFKVGPLRGRSPPVLLPRRRRPSPCSCLVALPARTQKSVAALPPLAGLANTALPAAATLTRQTTRPGGCPSDQDPTISGPAAFRNLLQAPPAQVTHAYKCCTTSRRRTFIAATPEGSGVLLAPCRQPARYRRAAVREQGVPGRRGYCPAFVTYGMVGVRDRDVDEGVCEVGRRPPLPASPPRRQRRRRRARPFPHVSVGRRSAPTLWRCRRIARRHADTSLGSRGRSAASACAPRLRARTSQRSRTPGCPDFVSYGLMARPRTVRNRSHRTRRCRRYGRQI